MRFTPNRLKWVLRMYPPFLFQRIWVTKIHKDFLGADVRIYKSLLNINSNRSIFGGTIFSAVDPIYPLLLGANLQASGIPKTVAWLKSARIEYKKPAHKSLFFSVTLNEEEILEALQIIRNQGKVTKVFRTEVLDKDGNICAISDNEVYIRDLNFDFHQHLDNKIIVN